MALNATSGRPPVSNSSTGLDHISGWVATDTTRGSLDILSSCCITIILCCWVSTFPNVPSPNDKWYHNLLDKFNLACIGLIGPNFLFMIALGQLSSAWRSVKLFRSLPCPPGEEWTLVHGFFADMGGFRLVSPDYPAFPVNAEQLYYLVKHGHMDYPRVSKRDIKSISIVDSLSKLITLWQVFWFSATELQRVREGLPMTTFELTALSYALTMLLTSLCWYAKPTILRPTMVYTKDERTLNSVRDIARHSTHPGLPSRWYRTPLDFVSPHRRFRIDVHWSYYAELTHLVRIPLFSRKIKALPWDRLPSYVWLVIEKTWLAPGLLVCMAFSVSPAMAWYFYFPTEGEKIIWRLCSVYHAVFTLGLVLYYSYVALRELNKTAPAKPPRPDSFAPSTGTTASPYPCAEGLAVKDQTHSRDNSDDLETGLLAPEPAQARPHGPIRVGATWLRSWRNISPDEDPDMALGLHESIPLLMATFLYLFSRLFFYVDNFVAIRQQPAGIYQGVNKYVPVIG